MTWTKSILPYNSVYINEHQKSKQPVNHYNQASHHHKNYCNLMTPSFTHPFSPNSSAQLSQTVRNVQKPISKLSSEKNSKTSDKLWEGEGGDGWGASRVASNL